MTRFENSIKEVGISEALKLYSPGVFVTKHVLDSRETNRLRLLLGTVAIFVVTFIDLFRKKKKLSTSYNTLIYVPNDKYTRFLTALVTETSYSYLVVSDTKLSVDSITLSSISSFSRFGYFSSLIKSYFSILKLCSCRKENDLLCQYYWTMFSVLRRELLLQYMLKKVSFKNFLSFQPIDSYHSLVQVDFKDHFDRTFAIRPTTTIRSEENRLYRCDVLFYKSYDEYEIYNEMCDSRVQLEEGGLLYPKGLYSKKSEITKKCIFFDTCTSQNEKWNKSRLSFIPAFLEFAKNNGLYVYYKFHPGLLANLKSDTKTLLGQYDNVEIISDTIPWSDVDFSIGFSSTIFYDSILYGVPVLDMGEMTYFFEGDNKKYCINRVDDLTKISELYNHKEEITDIQYKWLCREFHYPDGMARINSMLTE